MFETSVIVAYESLSCPQCEKNAGKPNTLWERKDFFPKNSRKLNCSGPIMDL